MKSIIYKKFTTLTSKKNEICNNCKKTCKNKEGSTLIQCLEYEEDKRVLDNI